MKIVLASNNPGKVKEFSAAFSSLNIELVPQQQFAVQDIEETGLSFVENALIKARHAAKITGLPALADDSGLAVAALNGAPGIYSARFAGLKAQSKDNIQKLLADLKTVPEEQRQAAFHCVLVFITHYADPTPLIVDGKWHGYILNQMRGELGFGYDPIFYIPDLHKTAAELPIQEKNKISHRGIAIQSFIKLFPEKIYESALRQKFD